MQNSVRLNMEHRRHLVAALAGRYDDKEDWKVLFSRSAQLAYEVYNQFYSADDTLAKIKRLPHGWLPARDAINAYFGDNTNMVKLHFNGLSRFLPWQSDAEFTRDFPSVSEPFLFADWSNAEAVPIKEGTRLFKTFTKLSAEGERLEKTRKDIEREIKQAIYSSSTNKTLIERWPQIAPIVTEIVTPYVTAENLPAPIMKNLNKKLGLAA